MPAHRKTTPGTDWHALAANPKTQWHRYGPTKLQQAAGALMGHKSQLAFQLAQLAAKKHHQASLTSRGGSEPTAA
jgi:hypothetical protein